MRIVRLYSDADGESHFEEVEIELDLTDYAPPAPPLYLSTTMVSNQFAFMKAPAGWSSDWHPSSARNLFFVLSGEWQVRASDGESRTFSVGSVLLVEDTTGKGHSSRRTSVSELCAQNRLEREVQLATLIDPSADADGRPVSVAYAAASETLALQSKARPTESALSLRSASC